MRDSWMPSLPSPAAWMEHAACRDHDPELFFAEDVSAEGRERSREAQRICRGCPVAAECLAMALETDSRYGIWGGHNAHQRRAMKRGRG